MAELWVNPKEGKNEGEAERERRLETNRDKKKQVKDNGNSTVREVGSKGYIDRYEDYRS